MSKRILITCTDLMMVQFLIPHVKHLSQKGYEIEVACSDVGGRMDDVKLQILEFVKQIHIVKLVRSPISLTNRKGYRELCYLVNRNHYDFIWTNEPVMGVMTRLAARKTRKNGTKVIYMVHGFHFYKGASLLHWGIFYPIERFCSRFCDEIVTINQEDYKQAKKMHAKSVKYIHGIGINTDRLHDKEKQVNIRKELGLKDDAFLLLSIGELSKRKNQQIIIRALGKLQDQNIHYILCGIGDLQKDLENLAVENNIQSNVHFLGYRKDVVDICSQSDLFALPSLHEGLSVASLEAMYCGLPVIISDIRGVRDYIVDGRNGFICDVKNVNQFAKRIKLLKENSKLRSKIAEQNKKDVLPYTIDQAKLEVEALFQ